MQPRILSIQAHRKEPEGRLKMRLYRRGYCLQVSTPKSFPLAKRRSRTNADKRRIVLAAAACTKPGEIGALMRREGVYSSALATWRRQYAADEISGAESKKRGPKAAPAREEPKQLALVTRERDKLRVQLSNAQLVIEVQKKVAALLEQLEPLTKFASP